MVPLIDLLVALAGLGGLRIWRRSRTPMCAGCGRRHRRGSGRIQLVPVGAGRAVWLCRSCLRASAPHTQGWAWLR